MVLSGRDVVRLRFDREEHEAGSRLAAGTIENAGLQWMHTHKRWGFQTEILDTRTDGGTPVAERSVAAAQFWFKPGPKLTLRAGRQQTLSGDDNNQTSFDVAYEVLPHLAFEVKGVDGTQGRSAQAGVSYAHGDSNVYLTRKLTEDAAGQRAATVLGVRSPLGKASKVYSEYQWEDSEGGGRVLRLIGLQRQWDAASGLRFQLSGEVADVNAPTGATSRSAVATGLSYSNAGGLSAATRQEFRRESGTKNVDQVLSVTQFDLKATEDLALVARLRYSRTKDRDLGTIDAKLDERVVGLAYRPVQNERFNGLFKYTHLADLRPLTNGLGTREERSMDVISVDTALQFMPRMEWLSKGAVRRMDETAGDRDAVTTSTYLFIQRLNLTVWKPVAFGVEYRILAQTEAEDRRQGWLTEAMWSFTRNFRAGVGYNFTDFSDDMTSGNDYRTQGWFLRLQGRY